MRKKEYYMVFDTETAGSLSMPTVYDFGFLIIDRQGNEILKDSFVISDVFYDNSLMSGAYYSNKIPQYERDIYNGLRKVIRFYELQSHIRKLCNLYNITKVYAYNIAFDKRALNNTSRLYNGTNNFFVNVEYYCIWNMACNMILNNRNYQRFCIDNGFISPKGNILTSAEIVHRYLTNDIDFVESHTGLADSEIETGILKKCWSTKKKMERKPNSQCWRIPQPR